MAFSVQDETVLEGQIFFLSGRTLLISANKFVGDVIVDFYHEHFVTFIRGDFSQNTENRCVCIK